MFQSTTRHTPYNLLEVFRPWRYAFGGSWPFGGPRLQIWTTSHDDTEARQDIVSRLSPVCSPWPAVRPLLKDDPNNADLIIHSISNDGRTGRNIRYDLRYRWLRDEIDSAWVLRGIPNGKAPRFLSYAQKGKYEMLETTFVGGVALEQRWNSMTRQEQRNAVTDAIGYLIT